MSLVLKRKKGVGLVLATVLLASLASEAAAEQGMFKLVQCDELHSGVEEGLRSQTAAYGIEMRCASTGSDRGAQISVVGAASKDRAGRIRWSAPADMEIVAVRVEAKLRRENGHRARLYLANRDLGNIHLIGTGADGPAPWKTYTWQASGSGRRQFVAELSCGRDGGCPQSNLAKTWIRNVRLTVVDRVRPTLQLSGDLFDEGWRRGVSTAELDGTDIGTGLSRLSVSADGESLYVANLSCVFAVASQLAYRWNPCRSTTGESITIPTDRQPLADGTNRLRFCAEDFAGNQHCLTRSVKVDNTPPALSFPNALNPRDPELIEVAAHDKHSGLVTGSVSLRPVDATAWEALPTQVRSASLMVRVHSSEREPGDYEFLARAADAAGNVGATTLRADGSPMILAFPLREGVRLEARLGPGGSDQETIPYGKASWVEGRLLDSEGRPLPGREVVIDEYFGPGALIDHRVRTVRTDAKGRWSSRLPVGPSRTVTASFGGDAEHLPATAVGGRLSVKTGTRFRISSRRVREGRAVRFHGRVGRTGARIPARGKLVQLQYFDPLKRRWFTVRNPFYTDSRGRYHTRYRFGNHYARDVKIRFRVRVLPEADWPYRPAASRPRSVKVLAR